MVDRMTLDRKPSGVNLDKECHYGTCKKMKDHNSRSWPHWPSHVDIQFKMICTCLSKGLRLNFSVNDFDVSSEDKQSIEEIHKSDFEKTPHTLP